MTRGRRVVAGGLVGALVVGGGAVAWAANASSAAASYRTATVTRATVHETLAETGSVEPRNQATLAFGTAGTVASVGVQVGDRVRAGEALARLRTAGLRAAVTDAQATLAAAKATMESDQDAQASAATDSATSDSSAATTPTTPSTGSTTPSTTTKATQRVLRRLARGQARVVAAQRAADQALAVSTAALAQQQKSCAAVATAPDSIAACSTALAAVDAAQHKAAAAQVTLEKAITALTAVLDQAVGAATGGSGATGSSTEAPAPSTTAPASTGTEGPTAARVVPAAFVLSSDATGTQPADPGGQGNSSGTVTAATLARDQATIDSARAALIRARADLRHSVLTSPIAGTVTSVAVARGDTVSAGGTTQVVVAGDGGDVDVTIQVSEGAIRSVKTGQRATVVADGATDELTGRVTAIGVMSASTDGTAAYPVTVTVPDAPASLASGSNAAVTLTIAVARDALTVPSSAVTTAGTGAVVRLLVDGALTPTRVEVGAVGDVRTEITSGLTAGQEVVLADLTQALPTNPSDGRGSFERFNSNGGGPPVTFSGGPPPGGAGG